MGDDVDTVNVTTQLTDPSSMLNLYRRLLAVRRSTPPLLRGEYHPLPDMPDTCFAFRRTTPGSAEVVVALNFGKAPVSIELGAARVLVGTHPDAADRVAGSLRLRPHEGLVMEVAP